VVTFFVVVSTNNKIGPDTDINSRLTEEQMMLKIFAYLERVFNLIRPQKLVYMAIDGCAPRAKMNQQRSRRFRSARDAAEAEEAARRRGDDIPEGQPFDSNCITPGTDFMVRLNKHLKWFIKKKIKEDPLWQSPQIILSGHDVPGEGEHKIMEHIRCARSSPHWKPNQRHCLYGLDADLIMLGLVTHEPHFCLLREKVRFGGGNRGQPNREIFDASTDPGDSFVLLQVGLLRDYLDGEMRNGLNLQALPFDYDLEHCIDDFVFLCYLVGNDFVPSLPTFDINEGALNNLIDTYMDILPSLGGYLVENGDVNMPRLEQILIKLGEVEEDVLTARAQDAEEFANKRGRGKVAAKKFNELSEEDAALSDFNKMADALMTGGDSGDIAATDAAPDSRVAAEPTMMSENFRRILLEGGTDENGKRPVDLYKEHYYGQKLGIDANNPEEVKQLAKDYLEGLIWVFKYYYCGCASWQWFYPHHYAPMASDLVGLSTMKFEFTKSEPFSPFQQLLSVMPSGSSHLLPRAYRPLMLESNSVIKDFYPEDFPIDFEGKRSDWEGVCLVPFINAGRLLAAESTIPSDALTKAEKERNRRALPQLYQYDEKMTTDMHPSPSQDGTSKYMPALHGTCCRVFTLPAYPDNQPPLQPVLAKGTAVGIRSPAGYPTLRTLQCEMRREEAQVNVLGTASRKESVMVNLDQVAESLRLANAQTVAQATLGQRCYIEWPYLREALVVGVSDATMRVTPMGPVKHTSDKQAEWQKEAAGISRDFRIGRGTNLGPISVILHVRVCEGLKTQLDGSQLKTFGDEEIAFPLQVTLRKHPAPDMRRRERAKQSAQEAKDAVPTGTSAVFLGDLHFGCGATVVDSPTSQAAGLVAIAVQPPAAALPKKGATQRLAKHVDAKYEAGHIASKRAKCSGMEFGRITSTLFVKLAEDPDDEGSSFAPSRVDLGLNLKHGAKGLAVPGFTRQKIDSRTGEPSGWEYTDRAVQLVGAYKKMFPWVFSAIVASTDMKLDAEDMLPGLSPTDANAQIRAAQKWIKSQPASKRGLMGSDSQLASDEAVAAIEASIPLAPLLPPPVLIENVSPSLLLRAPESGKADTVAAGGHFEMGDRVVFVGGLSDTGGVDIPFGASGTCVGYFAGKHVDMLLDVPVPGASSLFGRCSGERGVLVAKTCLLNISRPASAVTNENMSLKSKGSAPTIAPPASQWVARQAMNAARVSPAAAAAVEMVAAVAPSPALAAAAAAAAATAANATVQPKAAVVKGNTGTVKVAPTGKAKQTAKPKANPFNFAAAAAPSAAQASTEEARNAAAAAIMGSLGIDKSAAPASVVTAPTDANAFWNSLQAQMAVPGAAPAPAPAPLPPHPQPGVKGSGDANAFWNSLKAQDSASAQPPVPAPVGAQNQQHQKRKGASVPVAQQQDGAVKRGGFQGDARPLNAGEHPSGQDVEGRAERLENVDSQWIEPEEHNPSNPKMGAGASMSWQQQALVEGTTESALRAKEDASRGRGKRR